MEVSELAGLTNILENLLNIRYPILLGAMAGITDPILASAVSEAGGLGTLASVMQTGESLKALIRETRRLTNKPFAVNIPVHSRNASELVDTVIAEKVGVVITPAGSAKIFTAKLKKAGIIVIHLVSTPSMAKKAEEAGVDAVIASGFDAGGMVSQYHIGTLSLVPQVVDAVKIPVIAAGGIADARGYLAARVLGACGVSLGTAFLASKECHKIGNAYREGILKADAADSVIVNTGLYNAHVIKNDFYYKLQEMISRGASHEEIAKMVYKKDQVDEERLFICGQGVGLIKEIKSVSQIIQEMIKGSEAILKQMTQ
jgi:enoyl-[acyl-carrier protein] reductase II